MIQRSDFELLVLALRLELGRVVGEISEDHARLAELLLAMHQHRRFAHFIDGLSKLRRALRRRAEEVVPDRLPVGADQIEH